jgi:hypothetical protein
MDIGDFAKDVIQAPLVALHLSDETPNQNHVTIAMVIGLILGYIGGVYRGKKAPNSNVLGLNVGV